MAQRIAQTPRVGDVYAPVGRGDYVQTGWVENGYPYPSSNNFAGRVLDAMARPVNFAGPRVFDTDIITLPIRDYSGTVDRAFQVVQQAMQYMQNPQFLEFIKSAMRPVVMGGPGTPKQPGATDPKKPVVDRTKAGDPNVGYNRTQDQPDSYKESMGLGGPQTERSVRNERAQAPATVYKMNPHVSPEIARGIAERELGRVGGDLVPNNLTQIERTQLGTTNPNQAWAKEPYITNPPLLPDSNNLRLVFSLANPFLAALEFLRRYAGN